MLSTSFVCTALTKPEGEEAEDVLDGSEDVHGPSVLDDDLIRVNIVYSSSVRDSDDDRRRVTLELVTVVLGLVHELLHQLLRLEVLDRAVRIRGLLHEGAVKNLPPTSPVVVVAAGRRKSEGLMRAGRDGLSEGGREPHQASHVVGENLLTHDEARTGAVDVGALLEEIPRCLF